MKLIFVFSFLFMSLEGFAGSSFFICRGQMLQYPVDKHLIGNEGYVTLNMEVNVDQGYLKLDDMTCKINEVTNTFYAGREKTPSGFIDEKCSLNRLSLSLDMKVTERRLMLKKDDQNALEEGLVTVVYQNLRCTHAFRQI